MVINYAIGIGGTGARAMEALVHCCAAGLGPDRLTVFLIDPDEANGNLIRTKSLIETYQACRRTYRAGTEHPQQLFRTEIRTPDDLTWGVVEQQNARLDNYIHLPSLPRELQDLTRLLFSDEELTTELNEGFRGHPSIGAVMMANAEGQGPWQTFWQDVNNAQGEGSVRVFLVGSVFGGTGAAGIPTFGSPEMLKLRKEAMLDDRGGKGRSKIRLGAALVLPYFLFEMDAEANARAQIEMCVTPADFPMATKVALEYYDTKPLAFDDVYLIGDDSEETVGNFSYGARLQENRPHYIELVTALAAFDFLRAPTPRASPEAAAGPRYFTAGHNARVVDWEALPVSRDEDRLAGLQRAVQHALVSMAVFAYGFATYGAANFNAEPSTVLHTWYLDRFSRKPRSRGKGHVDAAARTALNEVASYAEMFLTWLAQLDGAGGRLALVRGDRLGVELGRGEPRLAAQPDTQSSRIPVLLKSGQQGDAVSRPARTAHAYDLAAVLLDERSDDPNASTAARYVDLFYRAATRFTEQEYGIAPAGTGA